MKDRTSEYARRVIEGKELTGHSEYLACKRHLDDMHRADFEYKFDAAEAEYHIGIANELTLGEGQDVKPLTLRGFQNFIVGSLFGWRRKRSKERRFREAYIQMGRQNGKSLLAGVMANDFASFSGYQYGRILLTATKQEQANIVWDEIHKFIRSDPELSELYRVKKYIRTIESKVTGTTIRAIGRDTKTTDGFRSVLAVTDELHAHPTNDMYQLMLDGQVGVDSALILAITTSGFDLTYPCYEHYKFCKRVLSGAIAKETLFVYIAELDDDDDIWEPSNWAKANPLQLRNPDGSLNQEMVARIAEKAIDAKEKQGEELKNFLTKTLNQWVTWSGGIFVDAEKWAACGTARTIEEMRGRDCYLGVDLSSGGDLTSIALVFALENDRAYVWSHSFMPELRLLEHERTDDAPYRIWKKQGLLTLTSGLYGIKTEYRAVIEYIRKLIADYDLRILGCGYDSHNAAAFLADLEEILDCDLIEVKQSARALNDPTVDFQLGVKAGLIEYDKANALMTWSVINATTVANSFDEIKIEKKTMTKRIDAVDAIIDAYKLYFEVKREPNGEEAVQIFLDALQRGGVTK